MEEIYQNISENVKEEISTAWGLAKNMDVLKATNFLDTFTKYFETRHSSEENEFLHFYLKLQMEKMKV